MTAFDLSVVIIGRNEGERLARCIASVKAAARPEGRFELIYVDSASTDGSVAGARALGATVVPLTGPSTAARGRNAGWRLATCPFVLFLDGDTELHPDFITAARPAFEDPRVAVVFGHRREANPRASVYNRVLDLDWITPTGPAPSCGGDALMRRDALSAVGGYDDALIAGEEPELCRRLRAEGHSILHIDAPMTAHDLDIRHFRQYWRRAVRTGHAYAEVAARFRGTADPLWSAEVRRSTVNGLFWMAWAAVAATLMVFGGSSETFGAVVLVPIALLLRTAWRARRRTSDPLTLLLYACHVQFSHVPIFLGQRAWRRRDGSAGPSRLIEYKSRPAR